MKAAVSRFQFHKGTIRTALFNSVCTAFFNFNSIKVRLEPRARKRNAHTLIFQFHKGTIRTCLKLLEGMRNAIIFQFHKGTIRTRSYPRHRHFSLPFQFHKGTIRTTAKETFAISVTNFNSIKVRLELSRVSKLHPFSTAISIP